MVKAFIDKQKIEISSLWVLSILYSHYAKFFSCCTVNTDQRRVVWKWKIKIVPLTFCAKFFSFSHVFQFFCASVLRHHWQFLQSIFDVSFLREGSVPHVPCRMSIIASIPSSLTGFLLKTLRSQNVFLRLRKVSKIKTFNILVAGNFLFMVERTTIPVSDGDSHGWLKWKNNFITFYIRLSRV